MIRPARLDDVATLVALIRELAEYERASEQVEIDHAMLTAALFGDEPSAFVRVAEQDGSVVAMVVYFRTFSTWTGHASIYIEDLYVQPHYRGQGIGRQLLLEVARIAVEHDCRRVEWSVLDWNDAAIGFYRSLGAVPLDEWTKFRLAGPALLNFANSA